jgi:hypothetical protein
MFLKFMPYRLAINVGTAISAAHAARRFVTSRLVVVDLAYEMVILHRAEEIELLLLERPEGAQLLEKAHGLIVIRLS